MNDEAPRFRIRILFGPERMMGPGKADLLERIAETGSIAAAGREMGMSYKRAWQLVEVMNRMFATPLVASSRGGSKGGGARVTETGQAVLEAYRGLEEAARDAGRDHVDRLQALLDAPSGDTPAEAADRK
ncbi:winged helix-turn-helix domain-containing protein [Pseudooceanicola algae]|uniref:Uncharacterized protein n=1 Tax=Pseudooceanicola algae TaxID=1537215 RepID=A0A418SHY3_9RHOB|nr:LysR family transcriptional regulator [Pseudooceanicola algae]QPM90233.1 hypothetical protein PSAL_014680 [Pseudooceanicola algae]